MPNFINEERIDNAKFTSRGRVYRRGCLGGYEMNGELKCLANKPRDQPWALSAEKKETEELS